MMEITRKYFHQLVHSYIFDFNHKCFLTIYLLGRYNQISTSYINQLIKLTVLLKIKSLLSRQPNYCRDHAHLCIKFVASVVDFLHVHLAFS